VGNSTRGNATRELQILAH